MFPFDSTLYATAAAAVRLGWTIGTREIGFDFTIRGRGGGRGGDYGAGVGGWGGGHTLCTTFCAWHVPGYNGMG